MNRINNPYDKNQSININISLSLMHHNYVNESRITKTLAVIMASFLCCWLLIRSFLDDPELIESS